MWSFLFTIGSVFLGVIMCFLFVSFILFSISVIKDELVDLGWIRDPDKCDPNEDKE